MRNINFIQWGIALTTALFISGCSDDDDSTQSGNKQGVITTEAIIPEPLQWNTDNTIALYAKKADSEKTLFYTEDSQVNQATFEAVKKAFPTPQEGDYIRAFYPAGKAKDKANATSTLLPAVLISIVEGVSTSGNVILNVSIDICGWKSIGLMTPSS